MKIATSLLLTAITCFLVGCSTTHLCSHTKWEYKTLVLPNDAVPVEPSKAGWESKDVLLNKMVKDGWVVAGYGIDHVNSQWFLLKRRKR